MASDGRADSNHLDQSSQSVSSAAAAKSKGGRPPHPIKEEFIKVGSSANASKRATYDCKHCNTSFTEQQATNPNLIKHIVSECSQCPSAADQCTCPRDQPACHRNAVHPAAAAGSSGGGSGAGPGPGCWGRHASALPGCDAAPGAGTSAAAAGAGTSAAAADWVKLLRGERGDLLSRPGVGAPRCSIVFK